MCSMKAWGKILDPSGSSGVSVPVHVVQNYNIDSPKDPLPG